MTYDPCTCCSSRCGVSRRNFIAGAGALTTLGGFALSLSAQNKEAVHAAPIRTTLKVQPILLYSVPKRIEARSWRQWGNIQTEEQASDERQRISKELAAMKAGADFPVEILPIASAQTPEDAAKAAKGDHDVTILYGAGTGVNVLEAATIPGKWTILFVRHRSGPVYLWYEIASARYLRKTVDEYGQPGVGPQDVVVDSHQEILWRLRALSGLKNTVGKRVVAVGGAGGWGVGGRKAKDISKDVWKMDIQTVSYDDLGKMIVQARQNDALVKRCRAQADKYLASKNVTLHTSKDFVSNSFILTEIFQQLMDHAETDAITINQCMNTIMPLSETTACLPLSLLNDQGYMAFCESDFVVIPAGILLHYTSGKPFFMNDPTYAHAGMVTLAHCTGARRMDGKHDEPVKLVTHFESDYGASPKVEMRKGQKITTIDADFNGRRWLGFEGEILGSPFLDICRCQIDVHMNCDTDRLNEETRGFHWMVCYGNYLKETGYALKKMNVDWLNLSKA